MNPLVPQAGRSLPGPFPAGVGPVQLPQTDGSPRQPGSTETRPVRIQLPKDSVDISPQASARTNAESRAGVTSPQDSTKAKPTNGRAQTEGLESKKSEQEDSSTGPMNLSDEEQDQVRKMRTRDTEVRSHEQAHMSAGGGLTGGASYEYEQGPDGNQYAVNGEVGISIPAGGSPQETVNNARQVRRAALAPTNPSGQDQSVAAQASQMEAQAQADIAKEARNGKDGESNGQANANEKPKDPAAANAARAYGEIAKATEEDEAHTPFAQTA